MFSNFFFILEIGPVTITTDPNKFQFELRELYVQVSNLFVLYAVRAMALLPPSNISSHVGASATSLHQDKGCLSLPLYLHKLSSSCSLVILIYDYN